MTENNDRLTEPATLADRLRGLASSFVIETDADGLARQRTAFRRIMREAADALTSASSAETPRPRESLTGVGPGFLMSGKLAELEVADLRSLLVELDIDDDDAKVVVTVAPMDDEPYDQMPRHIASISVAPR